MADQGGGAGGEPRVSPEPSLAESDHTAEENPSGGTTSAQITQLLAALQLQATQQTQLQQTLLAQQAEINLLKTAAAAASARAASEIEEEGLYLDTFEYCDRIAPGFRTHPERGESRRPHLYDLHGEQTFGKLMDDNKTGSAEEYRLLHCATYYLSCALKALEENVGEGLQEETEDYAVLRPIFNSLGECELWFRRRMAFIRAKSKSKNVDPNFVEFLRTQIYGETDTSYLGSSEVDAWEKEFTQAKTKQILVQGAKAAATRRTPGQLIPPGGGGRRSLTGGRAGRGGRGGGRGDGAAAAAEGGGQRPPAGGRGAGAERQ